MFGLPLIVLKTNSAMYSTGYGASFTHKEFFLSYQWRLIYSYQTQPNLTAIDSFKKPLCQQNWRWKICFGRLEFWPTFVDFVLTKKMSVKVGWHKWVVSHLVDRSLPTQEVRGSNPVIDVYWTFPANCIEIWKDENKRKRGKERPFLRK